MLEFWRCLSISRPLGTVQRNCFITEHVAVEAVVRRSPGQRRRHTVLHSRLGVISSRDCGSARLNSKLIKIHRQSLLSVLADLSHPKEAVLTGGP